MPETRHRNRRARQIENDLLRLTVLVEGGHIAELLHKESGVNPLWTPPWPSMEPSAYDSARHPEYGAGSESKLLAGIMGHNLCLDIFGPPSEEEAAAGVTVHGEAPVALYEFEEDGGELAMRAELPLARMRFERRIHVASGSCVARFTETLESTGAFDHPTGWTQHVTLGPPFLEKGATEFRASATRSKVPEGDFAGGKGYMKPGAEFDWPHVPALRGGAVDMRTFTNAPVSAAFTSHLMDPEREQAFFVAWAPRSRVLVGYVWKQADFPWLAIWEENCSREGRPWNGRTLTRGMEFGVSPVAETRREMIDRGKMFGVPGFRWLPAKRSLRAEYCAFVTAADKIPDSVWWDGAHRVEFS